MGKLINEIGNTYGYLTVIERAPSKNNRAMWKCKCKCGNEVIVAGKLLRNGQTKSCGCLKIEKTIERNIIRGGGDLTGQRFGKLTVIKFHSWLEHENHHKERLWECRCDCGNICLAKHAYLRYGDVSSCGCSNSRGNATILRWLNEHHIFYQDEYSFKDLAPKGTPYRFDFAILNPNKTVNFLIEYQGSIHFETNNSGWNTNENLQDIQNRDKIKYNYCKEHNIKLYYITYKDNIEEKLEEIFNERYETNN